MRRKVLLAIASALLPVATVMAGSAPSPKCGAAKHKAVGNYHSCVRKAEGKAFKTGATADVLPCSEKFEAAWNKAEDKNAGDCADTLADPAPVLAYLSGHAVKLGEIVAGTAAVPRCGDGAVNVIGELCDGSDLNGTTCASLFHSGGTLACNGTCVFDATGCTQ